MKKGKIQPQSSLDTVKIITPSRSAGSSDRDEKPNTNTQEEAIKRELEAAKDIVRCWLDENTITQEEYEKTIQDLEDYGQL